MTDIDPVEFGKMQANLTNLLTNQQDIKTSVDNIWKQVSKLNEHKAETEGIIRTAKATARWTAAVFVAVLEGIIQLYKSIN